MADSLTLYNPQYTVLIGLADKIDSANFTDFFQPYEILPVEQLGLGEFDHMKKKYTLLGLTCALKSFYGSYLLENREVDRLIYIDSDIYITGGFEYLEKCLDTYSIIVSPHVTSPFPDDNKRPSENVILNVGIYNGGFFALRNDDNARSFLNWWKKQMKEKCYENPAEGFFDDQIWLNLVPLYFQKVLVLDHPGYNVAYWNLHERFIEQDETGFVVNKEFPLIFFHYSGYSLSQPNQIARHQDRFVLRDFPALVMLFKLFHEKLMENRHSDFLKIKCVYRKRSPLKAFLNKVSRNLLFPDH
ncbi:MAG: glycosyl transferase [Chitinophagaceae bacterium]|nr:glycosyl transferase [Chitinophagaceae bacterium]MCA6454994.1 glycosyl transferase [Chitinophagaceae bacterium]MCA6459866.1 glycosyl transferase [Chitinophagaceae bacterium]MCA6465725.1 glycosyl transferase [Chitinophagaceae bacterium]